MRLQSQPGDVAGATGMAELEIWILPILLLTLVAGVGLFIWRGLAAGDPNAPGRDFPGFATAGRMFAAGAQAKPTPPLKKQLLDARAELQSELELLRNPVRFRGTFVDNTEMIDRLQAMVDDFDEQLAEMGVDAPPDGAQV